MADEFQIGDQPIFKATIKEDGIIVDLTGATLTKLIFKKPNTTAKVEVNATLTGTPTDGILQFDFYNQTAILLDTSGIWSFQPTGKLANSRIFFAPIEKFKVNKNL